MTTPNTELDLRDSAREEVLRQARRLNHLYSEPAIDRATALLVDLACR